MRQGREIILWAVALLAGNVLGSSLALPAAAYLAAAAAAAVISRRRPSAIIFILTFILLGAASVQICRLPPLRAPSHLGILCSGLKARFSAYLGGFFPPGDERALLQALVAGDRSGITRQIRGAFGESGAMHLLALSGLHIGIVYLFASRILSLAGGSIPVRRIRSAVILALLWAYACITGLSPSICRAVTMITIHEIALARKASSDPLRSLAIAAIVLALADPECPREAGFQLSFAACLGIFVIYPRLKGLLSIRMRIIGRMWDGACLAIACQLTAGMFSWHLFGIFPKYFLLTQMLAVPVAGALLYMVPVMLAAAPLPHLQGFLAQIALHTTKLLYEIVRLIADLS